jgi:hypothetical protein
MQEAFHNLIWAHFLLRKKPGFAGLRFAPAPAQVPWLNPFNPLRTNRPVHPQYGWTPIPIIGTLITDFELITFE